MAFDDIPWDANQEAHSGEKVSDGDLIYSMKNAQDIAALMTKIIAALDFIDAN